MAERPEPGGRGHEQLFGPVFIPGRQVPAESWEPVYDDLRVPRRPHVLASAVPFLFFVFAQPELPVPNLGWAPEYPSIARAAQIHASQVQSVFADFTETIPAPTPDLSWSPEVPADPRRPRILLSPLAAAGATLQAPANPLDWLPEYPRTLLQWSRLVRAADQTALFVDPFPQPTIDVWTPSYPDAPVQLAPRTAEQSALFWAPEPIFDPTGLEWRAHYPDRLDPPPALSVASQRAFFRPELPLEAAPDRSWTGVYPDAVEPGRGLRADLQRAAFFDPEPLPVPVDELGWRPRYPDQFLRGELHVSRIPAYTDPAQFQPALPVPDLAWLGAWPDRLDIRPSLAHQPPSTVGWEAPVAPAPENVVEVSYIVHVSPARGYRAV